MIDFNLVPILPELFLAIAAMGLLIVGVNAGNIASSVLCWACAGACGIAFVAILVLGGMDSVILNGMFHFSDFTQFMKLLILLGLMAVLVLAGGSLKEEGIERFEFPILVLLAGLGMMLMVSAHNFLSLYMGLELQSLSLYVLAAMRRNSGLSAEAGVKYFILGALSSGLILFGISLIYGFTGSVDFSVIESTLSIWSADVIPLGVVFGLVFLLAGLAFKISAVPFHMWTPDVYQGAPTIVTALFAIVPKLAAFAILIRVLYEPFVAMEQQWGQVIYALALGSMVVGAFGALKQENMKRLLAYSSIGNMGYALVGLVVVSPQGLSAVVLYLLIYMVMSIGVFAVLLSMRRDGLAVVKIGDFAGLSQRNPVLAYSLAILMFSMSGIPPFAGFFGKLFVFQAAMAGGYYVLAVLGVLSSVVAAYYYLRVVKVMFFDVGQDGMDGNLPFARKIILGASVAFVVLFIVKPSVFIDITRDAALALFSG